MNPDGFRLSSEMWFYVIQFTRHLQEGGFEQDFTLSFEENPVQNNEIRTP